MWCHDQVRLRVLRGRRVEAEVGPAGERFDGQRDLAALAPVRPAQRVRVDELQHPQASVVAAQLVRHRVQLGEDGGVQRVAGERGVDGLDHRGVRRGDGRVRADPAQVAQRGQVEPIAPVEVCRRRVPPGLAAFLDGEQAEIGQGGHDRGAYEVGLDRRRHREAVPGQLIRPAEVGDPQLQDVEGGPVGGIDVHPARTVRPRPQPERAEPVGDPARPRDGESEVPVGLLAGFLAGGPGWVDRRGRGLHFAAEMAYCAAESQQFVGQAEDVGR